ncbi:DNA topoisomerase I [Sphingobacteriaceae bacterium]|nr:DNA topoisomerase I [Sphingobacteriaceae bacterium]
MHDNIMNLSQKEMSLIVKDAVKTAEAVNLIYVKDAEPGINRVKKGEKFHYVLKNKKVNSKNELDRIKSLVIPPAWQNVWICVKENGHLQATGLDIKNRKQYRYHPLWNALRNQTKFYRLHEFGTVLPQIRVQLEKDLSLPGLPLQKILALIVSLMEQTNIRIGNDQYEKLYGSYGLTTLKDKHVKFSGNNVQFAFKGKKGVHHSISINNKRLALLVKQCRDIPGKELFQYIDENKRHHCVDSGMVNEYIKKISGKDFSAKDFRTWSGTIHALMAFKTLGNCETQTETKKKIVEALDIVSKHLGNTRTVCKKYYVHPVIVSLYETKQINRYFSELEKIKPAKKISELHSEEKILMKIFEKEAALSKSPKGKRAA